MENICPYCQKELKIINFKKRAKMFFIFTLFVVGFGISINGLNIIDFILLLIGFYISYLLNKRGITKICTNKDCINK